MAAGALIIIFMLIFIGVGLVQTINAAPMSAPSGASQYGLFGPPTVTPSGTPTLTPTFTPTFTPTPTGLLGDMNGDCRVDILDIMYVAGRWNTQVGDPDYDPKADMNSDGKIDVLDIMTVSGQWLNTCEGDQAPDVGSHFINVGLQGQFRIYLPVMLPGSSSTAQIYFIDPAPSHKILDGNFVVEAAIRDVKDLGGFEFTILYDPSILKVEDVQIGSFLGSTGRNVFKLGPVIDNDSGAVRLGAFSFGNQSGPNGEGILARIEFHPVGDGLSALTFQDAAAADASGNPIVLTLFDGEVRVLPAPPTPTPTPTITPTATDTPTITPTATDTPVPTPTPTPMSGTTLYTSPISSSHSLASGAFTLDVWVNSVSDLGGFQFTLHFDPNILHVDDASLGPFLGSTGRSISQLGPDIDNNAGTLTFGGFSFGSEPGVSGSGVIAHIQFSPQHTGETSLTWSDDTLSDTVGNAIAHSKINGKVTITP